MVTIFHPDSFEMNHPLTQGNKQNRSNVLCRIAFTMGLQVLGSLIIMCSERHMANMTAKVD